MTDGKRERDVAEAEAEVDGAATVGRGRDDGRDQLVARGGGDRGAYANILRDRPGAMAQNASALHAGLGNAFTMQVMDEVEGDAERGPSDIESYAGARGAPAAATKHRSIADFEKDMAVLRDRYDARMRALSENGEEVQNNPGVVPGDPGVEYKLNDPIVSGNRLLADTKKKIDELEDAKSGEKAGSARWNTLNKMQQDLLQWGGILWEEEYRYRELLKKRGFKASNLEPFP